MTRYDPNPVGHAEAPAPRTAAPSRAGEITASPLARTGQLAGASSAGLGGAPREERSRTPGPAAPESDPLTGESDVIGLRLMTTHDVCAVFGRTPRTIRNWVRAGRLRPVRVGRSVFFRPEEVELLAGAGPPSGQEDEPQSPGLSGP